jgi:hypothetical protein
VLTVQKRRTQPPRRVEVSPNGVRVEKVRRVRAVGYVLVSLSMIRGTYERFRSSYKGMVPLDLPILSAIKRAKENNNAFVIRHCTT